MNALASSLLVAGLAVASQTARAESGPTPPVAIRDSTDPWVLEIDLDRERYLELYVTRVVHDSKHEVRSSHEELVVQPAAPRATLALAIERGALGQAEDGVYVQRISIDAIPLSAADGIYHAQRALYFRVSGGLVERIGIREYSAVADPVHYERDASGHELRVHAGTAILHAPERVPGPVHDAIPLPRE